MTRQDEFVRRLIERQPGIEEDEIDVFAAWLKENGPDEWHRWAIDWNWDHGTELFEWIVAQPNCDKGTVLSIYYGGQPDYFAKYATLEEALAVDFSGDNIAGLLAKICEMWKNGAYPTYNYHPSEGAVDYLAQGEEAMQAIAATVPWEVPVDFAAAGIRGESNCFERSIDGVPVEMLRALGEKW